MPSSRIQGKPKPTWLTSVSDPSTRWSFIERLFIFFFQNPLYKTHEDLSWTICIKTVTIKRLCIENETLRKVTSQDVFTVHQTITNGFRLPQRSHLRNLKNLLKVKNRGNVVKNRGNIEKRSGNREILRRFIFCLYPRLDAYFLKLNDVEWYVK